MKRQTSGTIAACMVAFLVSTSLSAIENTVKASRFGFDRKNATKCLQTALDSGAKTVIIDNCGAEWLCKSIKINRDNLTVIFDKDVKVRALPGAFPNKGDALFLLSNRKNISFVGREGSLITMNKEEYRKISSRFQGGHRHAFRCTGNDGVTFRGMTITSSGGDGIYVGHGNRNFTIENTSCLDHARQGISVISCHNLLIRNCHFDHTNGTPPQAGIDFEPNSNNEELVNCVVENSTFNHNSGGGLTAYLPHLDSKSPPISITVRNCKFIGNTDGVILTPKRDARNPITGFITLENCQIAKSKKTTMRVVDPGKDLAFSMTGCTIDNRGNQAEALTFTSGSITSPDLGNITIEKVDVLDDSKRPPIHFKPLFGCGVTKDVSIDISLNGKPYDINPSLAKLPTRTDPRPVLTSETTENLVIPTVREKIINPKQRLNLRGDHSFMLLASKGDKINLWLQANPTLKGRKPARISASLKSPKENTIKKVEVLSDGTEHQFALTAEESGMYLLKIRTRGQLVNVWSDHAGQGLLVSPDLPMLSPKCKYYFEVPANVTDTCIVLCGSSAVEIVNDVALLSPSGKVVQTEKNTDCAILRIRRPASTPAEIWCLDIRKTKEDCYILMGEHLKPLVSGSPQLLLRSK